MRYEKIHEMTRQEAEAIFQQGSAEEIGNALLSVTYYDEDWKWVEALCLQYLEHPDKNIRAVAATCLGHLARIHGTLDLDVVVPALQSHLSDPDVAGRASDALDDISIFIHETPKA